MPTHSQLALQVKERYRDYANVRSYTHQFKTVPKKTLFQLLELHETYDNSRTIDRPPPPSTPLLRHEAHDAYKQRMQRFLQEVQSIVSVQTLSVPQIETVANFLAGIKHPGDRISARRKCSLGRRIDAVLRDYACEAYFPVKSSGLHKELKKRILTFLETYRCRHPLRPPLPGQKKLFMQEYYHYRMRAQEYFDKTGFPVGVEYLTLPLIEALLNFLAGQKYPQKEKYRRIFAANAIRPVEHFVSMYKPYENGRFPITADQYHGRKNEIVPLLYFKPEEPVDRWFPPPKSNKIRKGRSRLFLNYKVFFDRLGVSVEPRVLPITYIEAVINYARTAVAAPGTGEEYKAMVRAG